MRLLIGVVALLIAAFVKADFNSALDFYAVKDYPKAFQGFMELAKIGDKRSQFNLGVMHLNGEHVSKDINKAYAWIKLASESDTLDQQTQKIYQLVSSKVKDQPVANAEYEKLASLYSTQALLKNLYPEFLSQQESEPYFATPVKIVDPKFPKKAAMNGISGWTRYEFDLDIAGVPRNLRVLETFPHSIFLKASMKAIKQWRFEVKKDDMGNPLAQKNMRFTMQFALHPDGIQVKKSIYKRTLADAQNGSAESQYKMGFYHQTFNNLTDRGNANEWYLQAATQGMELAQYQLGRNLIYGQSCKKDKKKGIVWLTQAATSGQDDAQLFLASLLSDSHDKASQLQALQYFKSVDKLNTGALVHYAWMLAGSAYTEVADPKKALKLVKELEDRRFFDEASIYEINAAAYAAMGKFKKAVALQKYALDEAENMDADLSMIKAKLANYRKANKI